MHRILTTTAGIVGGILIALAAATPAYADPSPGELEKQIDAKWNELEPVIEQHNQVASQLAGNRAKVAQLTAQIQPLQKQVDAARAKLNEVSSRYYRTGSASAFNALLVSGSPTQFAEQLSTLEIIARNHEARIHDVVVLKAHYDALKKPLDALVVNLAAQEAQLVNQAKQINEEIKTLNEMRVRAYGTTAGTGSLRPVACPVDYPGGAAGVAVHAACAQVGKPYVWASSGPNTFDCSGLTLYAWGKAGVTLGHFTRWQWSETRSVSRADLRAGDLVFYYGDLHHVAMYIGGGWVVHAPHSGDVVRLKRLDDGPIAGFRRPG